jgi:hypothetical protein
MDILLAGKSALPCFKQEQTAVFYVQRRFSLPVEIIPVKVNAIPVVTEKCSASPPERRSPCHRIRVHLPTGIAFGFDRIPHRGCFLCFADAPVISEAQSAGFRAQ